MKDIALWEEKNSTEPTTKSKSNPIIVPNDTTKEIKIVSVENVCEDTGMKREKGNREKTNWVGKSIRDVLIIKQFIGKKNRTYVSYSCPSCNEIHSSRLMDIKSGKIKGKCCRKPFGEASFNSLYAGYRNNARIGGCGKPNKEFSISKDEAKILFKGNCFYCGSPPSQVYKSKGCNGEFIYNGIDRKDNAKGYIIENCVSCCSFCNYTKNDTSIGDFLKWVRKVYEITKNFKISS
jgi:hypothetical protein